MKATKCLIKSCKGVTGEKGSACGLCRRCYASARSVVTRKKTTWEHLVSIGMAAL